MIVGFRVDANENIASGHMVRCITLAKELVKRGCEVVFYLAQDKETWRLSDNGFNYEILNSDWRNLNDEINVMAEIIQKGSLDWLVVDSYQVDNEYLSLMNKYCKIAYIDDMAVEKYDVSAVIHYGLIDTEYALKYDKTDTICITGPEYIPLREEFSDRLDDSDRGKSILITTGGIDTFNVTLDVLKYLVNDRIFDEYSFYAVVGSMNSYEDQIRAFAKANTRVNVLKNISNISYYMRKCDMAVSAGGTTLYELCACNTPTVCFSFADNQFEFAKRMEKDGLMLCAGDPRFDDNIGKRIVSCLEYVYNDVKLKKSCIDKMRELVDGKGAWRIANKLIEVINTKDSVS
jgi:UDP-2,4-diacetamido-2,4,6-trideoxy-beta-L-altropyranose hydrolase